MSIVFTSLKHPKLPISIKIPVTLLQIVLLHDSYIIKFEIINYLFANLLVAWLNCKIVLFKPYEFKTFLFSFAIFVFGTNTYHKHLILKPNVGVSQSARS